MKKTFVTVLFASAFFYANADRIDEIEKAEESTAHGLEKKETSIIIEKEAISEEKVHRSEEQMDSKIKKLELNEEEKAQIEQAEDIDIQKEPIKAEQYDEDNPLIPDQMQKIIEDDVKADESSDLQKQ